MAQQPRAILRECAVIEAGLDNVQIEKPGGQEVIETDQQTAFSKRSGGIEARPCPSAAYSSNNGDNWSRAASAKRFMSAADGRPESASQDRRTPTCWPTSWLVRARRLRAGSSGAWRSNPSAACRHTMPDPLRRENRLIRLVGCWLSPVVGICAVRRECHSARRRLTPGTRASLARGSPEISAERSRGVRSSRGMRRWQGADGGHERGLQGTLKGRGTARTTCVQGTPDANFG
jgi:hypothetical protein